ncbi:hypothetical protein [Clavibacter michiganensis]
MQTDFADEVVDIKHQVGNEKLLVTSVALVASDKSRSEVVFGSGLSVVQGPSDTGKSFMVDAIDFVLGSSKLRAIPEMTVYDYAEVGLRTSAGLNVTLQRRLAGGNIILLSSDSSGEEYKQSLAFRHRAGDVATLSGYLLDQVGLLGRLIRRNKQNKLISLSFRDVAHLSIINEIDIQSDTPPVLTGQYTTATKELAAFRAIVEDTDDSLLVETQDKSEQKKITAGQVRLIDSMLDRLALESHDYESREELEQQLARIQTAVRDATSSRRGIYVTRDGLGEKRSKLRRKHTLFSARVSDLSATLARLRLLSAQYRSDLQRLELMQQADLAMSFFETADCAYCGAHPEDQHVDAEEDSKNHAKATIAEIGRTNFLVKDLDEALELLVADLAHYQAEASKVSVEIDEVDKAYYEAEAAARPASKVLRELLSTQKEAVRQLLVYEQVAELEGMRRLVDLDAGAESPEGAQALSGRVVDDISAGLVETLTAWGYEGAKSVRFDLSTKDIWVNGQPRSSHGKGVRALLHAAFTVAVAQYCLERDLPHPGFIVLDSPLVTFRAADVVIDGDVVDAQVASLFYQDLADRFLGQVIVLENVDVPEGLGVDVSITKFSGDEKVGRFGFLQSVFSSK